MSKKLATVALELVDEPATPIRQRFDEGELEELTDSIKSLGLIEPLVVERVDGRFRVIAGHRRLLGCRRAGLLRVDVVIRGDADTHGDAVMLQENIVRADLSPAEEARKIERVYLAAGEDIEKTAAVLKVTVAYIDSRLALLKGDPDVLAALDAGEISIGVAEELNKVTREEWRKAFVHDARATGVNIRQAREWRLRANASAQQMELAAARGDTVPVSAPPTGAATSRSLDCEFCFSGQELHLLRQVYMHVTCYHAMRAILERREEKE